MANSPKTTGGLIVLNTVPSRETCNSPSKNSNLNIIINKYEIIKIYFENFSIKNDFGLKNFLALLFNNLTFSI